MFKGVANISDYDSIQVCRLCLVKKEDLVYLFNPKGYQGVRLREVIEELLQEEVTKEDGLPWTICKGCVSKVMEFKHFKTMCIEAKISYLTMVAKRSSEFCVKEEVNEDDTFSEAGTHDQEILHADEFACVGVSNDESLADPLDLINIKEDADAVESCSEADPYNTEKHQEYESLDEHVSNVVCLPLVREELSFLAPRPPSQPSLEPTETILKREGSETSRRDYDELEVVESVKEESPVVSADEDPPQEVTISRSERDTGHGEKAYVKEEVTTSESLSEAENSSEENPHESDSSNDNVSNVVPSPLEMEDLVEGCNMARGSIQRCEEILSDPRDDRKKNIKKKFERNTSLSSLPGENSQSNMLNLRDKKEETLISGDHNTNAYKLSDIMLRHLDSHKKQLAGSKSFVCNYCGVKNTDKKKLVIHVRDHISRYRTSTSVMPECSYLKCSESRRTGNQSPTPFKCEMCGKEFKSKSFLRTHYVVHRNLKPFSSETCEKEFKRNKTLQENLKMHLDLQTLKCETCGKRFKWKSALIRHLAIHSNLKPFKCSICEKVFKYKSDLIRHLAIHSDSKPFKCATCGKDYNQMNDLRKHLVIHSGLKLFKCDRCGKGFTHKCNLVSHSAMHSDLRPFKCETCGKSFKCNSNLKRHIASHSGLKPFKCDTCRKGFTQKSNLGAHLVIHTGLRPFKCDTCGKGFTQKCNLVAHLIVHSSLRPFKCLTCGKEFKRRKDFREHSKVHS